jgi:hypothetical protein
MEGLSPELEPADVIRTRARELVLHAREYGWVGPPFDPLTFASLHGIKTAEGPVDLLQDALIRPLSTGELEIQWSPSAVQVRRNFSIFHEIGHTIFPDCSETVRFRRDRPRFDPDGELESLCDLAASEMLMPEPEFPRDLDAAGGFGAASIELLARTYAASREAAARRAVALTPHSVAVFLTMRHKPADRVSSSQGAFDFYQAPPAKLRVDYFVANESVPGFVLPPHKSVPDESCVYDAVVAGLTKGAQREVWTGSAGREFECGVDALALSPDTEGRARVLALLQLQ